MAVGLTAWRWLLHLGHCSVKMRDGQQAWDCWLFSYGITSKVHDHSWDNEGKWNDKRKRKHRIKKDDVIRRKLTGAF